MVHVWILSIPFAERWLWHANSENRKNNWKGLRSMEEDIRLELFSSGNRALYNLLRLLKSFGHIISSTARVSNELIIIMRKNCKHKYVREKYRLYKNRIR